LLNERSFDRALVPAARIAIDDCAIAVDVPVDRPGISPRPKRPAFQQHLSKHHTSKHHASKHHAVQHHAWKHHASKRHAVVHDAVAQNISKGHDSKQHAEPGL
jgi:hypothetical protein